MKIVDNTIIWAKDEAELEERIETALRRCEESNITISRKKMELGNSIHFVRSGKTLMNEVYVKEVR